MQYIHMSTDMDTAQLVDSILLVIFSCIQELNENYDDGHHGVLISIFY